MYERKTDVKLFDIEKIILNKYSKLDIKEQNKYLIAETRKILDNNIKINMNYEDILHFIELNNNKIDNYVIKLIEDNNLNKKQILEIIEKENIYGK